MDESITDIPITRCLQCGARLNAIGTSDGAAGRPTPGDPVACIRCGGVMTIDGEGKLRGFTDQEADEMLASRETMNDLARLVRRIHLVRAKTA